MQFRHLSVLLACLLGAASLTCSKPASSTSTRQSSTPAPSYTARGNIRAIDTTKKTILIAHRDIPGYMKAMTMQFELRDASLAKGVSAGDEITFTFTDEGDGRLVVQTMQKAAP
ncbi:Hypothetical protein A7982_06136 [Minicystis rosea]|nr:Hypothetical protein A7982_06136 [Minicystis rosea]